MPRDAYASLQATTDDLLSEWRWLIGDAFMLWRVTLAGDALLRDSSNGSIHLLNIAIGAVERIAANTPEFDRRVADPDFAERILRTQMLAVAARVGLHPAAGECLSHRIPLVLGGADEPANLDACDISVHLSLAGQIHRQVHTLPPGTKINDVSIRDRDPE